MKKISNIGIVLFILLSMSSCQQSEYEQLLEQESKSAEIHNGIFNEFELGMDINDFYAICRKGSTDGTYDNTPENWVTTALEHEGTPFKFTFFPGVNNGVVYRMPIDINHQSWAIWNEDSHSDKLLPKVMNLLHSWYGEDFIEIENDKGQKIYVDIDGNREVVVGIKDNKTVSVMVSDYKLEMEIQKQSE